VLRSQGVEAAVAMLEEQTQEFVRRKTLKAFLREIARAEADPEMIGKVFRLLHSTSEKWYPILFDRECGLELAMRLPLDDLLAVFRHTSLEHLPDGFLHGVGARILRDPETAQPVLSRFVEMGGNRDNILRESADIARKSGYSALEFDRFVEKYGPGAGSQVFSYFLSGYFRSRGGNCVDAAEEAGQISSPLFRRMLFGHAILYFGSDNPVLAHGLLQERKDWFDVEENDDLMISLINDLRALQDQGLARVWVEQILDPDLRGKLRKQVDDRWFEFNGVSRW
jgi:hypothetical protein